MIGFGGSNTGGNSGANRANRAENDRTAAAQGQGQEPHRRGIPTGAAIRRVGHDHGYSCCLHENIIQNNQL